MTRKYVITFSVLFSCMIGFNVFLAIRDNQLLKAYDACMIRTSHPDCPTSWKTKPAFAHR